MPTVLESPVIDLFNVPVLDKGFVRLEQNALSDSMVVRAAKVSFANDSVEDVDFERFIGFLMRNRHGSPFEHGSITLHVKAPIMVFREWHRHRVGFSYNEMSGRYTVLPEEWYVPARDDIRHQVGKPGSYRFERMEDDDAAEAVRQAIDQQCSDAFATYNRLLAEGVAKEVARGVLPVYTYSMMYATMNARSLMNFLSLRNAPDAQLEIRRYAEVVERMFIEAMPVTAAQFIAGNRIAP